MNAQTKSEIQILLKVARPKIEAADQGGGHALFNSISEEFGPVAHRVYLALDLPVRTCGNYHNRAMNRILLDPYTVLNRASSFKAEGRDAIDSIEFWNHADIIKTLIDYLALKYSNMETINANAQ